MASSTPVQSRAVDPYASYNSNIVNQLTGIVNRGSNVLDYDNSLQVVTDSTATDSLIVLPGIIYKDDMLIHITSQHTVDFTDPTHYVSASGDPFNTTPGIYYIVLEYTYIKSRPAPEAKIKILLPNQTSSFRSGNFPSLFFLKAVDVTVPSGNGTIGTLYDYDPSHQTTKREYVKNYASTEIFLPVFEASRDQSRIVYSPITDQYYFGYSDRWGSPIAGSTTIQGDTSGLDIGDLVRINAAGNFVLANASAANTTADGVVSQVGMDGLVQTVGRIGGVSTEIGSNVNVGDMVYLSTVEDGKITDEKTPQFVGRCMSITDATTVTIIFHRGEPTSILSLSKVLPSGGSWVLDSTSGLYSQTIDISSFGSHDVVVEVYDVTTKLEIEPSNIEFAPAGTITIWMPDNTHTLNVTIVG